MSVSLPDGDVEFLDAYASERGLPSRSAVVHRAVELLRSQSLESEYAAAFAAWDETRDAGAWASTVADGLPDHA